MARFSSTESARTADDAALLDVLTKFMSADKTLTAPITWVQDGADLRFAAALDIEGVTVEGITLFGRASGALPDRKVTIGLRWQDEAGRGGNFDRLEWKPIKAHTNRPNAPAHLRLRLIEGSHRHPLALNGALDIGLMRAIRENLPVAEPLDAEPPDWPALLAVASTSWRIEALVRAPPPPWQYPDGRTPQQPGTGRVNDTASSNGLEEVAGQVARGLSKAGMLDGRAFIRTPVLFPSGATVVVVLEEAPEGRYRLTDLGQGRDETDMLGFASAHTRQAQEVARFSGLRLDGGAMTLLDVNRDQLIAGTMAVANASARAVERTMLRAAQRPEEASIERLVVRLTALFPRAEVTREIEVRGASTHAWPVAAMVTMETGRAVFDVVKPSPVSVVFASAKFHDFARLEDAPARVAVVHRKAALGDLLTVVAQAARVVEDDAPDPVFTRAVAA